MHPDSWIRILFFILFFFLSASMFFNRIAPRFGYTFPLNFIGVQIGLSVVVVFLHAWMYLGIRNAILFVCTSTGIGFLVEWLGSSKGWIFGKYRYTDKSGPKLFHRVPVFVPFMWCVIAYMGFWTAKWILRSLWTSQSENGFVTGLTASLLLTAWDLVADPLVVHEGAWIWEKKGKYYGVPASNFIGWFILSAVIYGAWGLGAGNRIWTCGQPDWTAYLPVIGYGILTGVFSAACFERHLKIPGIIGLITVFILLISEGIRLM